MTNITCSIYGEEYQYPPQKDWTQSRRYKEWWHKAFTVYEPGQFACCSAQESLHITVTFVILTLNQTPAHMFRLRVRNSHVY